MQANTKSPLHTHKPTAVKKTATARHDGKPKVKMGTGRAVLVMSDTLFDEDLKE